MQVKQDILGRDGKPMYKEISIKDVDNRLRYVPVYGSLPLIRVGFFSPVPPRFLGDPNYIHDPRPICWPVFHPFWTVSQKAEGNVMMAYVDSLDQVKMFWPEAENITIHEEGVMQYAFNKDFPELPWLEEVHHPDFKVAPPVIGVYRLVNTETEEVLYGYSDDVEYAVQLQSHKLMYGVHEDKEFQDNLVNYDALSPTIHPAATLAAAEKLARDLQEFNEDKGELPTTLYIGDDE